MHVMYSVCAAVRGPSAAQLGAHNDAKRSHYQGTHAETHDGDFHPTGRIDTPHEVGLHDIVPVRAHHQAEGTQGNARCPQRLASGDAKPWSAGCGYLATATSHSQSLQALQTADGVQ